MIFFSKSKLGSTLEEDESGNTVARRITWGQKLDLKQARRERLVVTTQVFKIYEYCSLECAGSSRYTAKWTDKSLKSLPESS